MFSRIGRRRNGVLVAALLAGLGSTLFAGPAGPYAAEQAPAAGKTDSERIAELEKRVAELEEMLRRALEAGSVANAAELQRKIDALSEELERSKMGAAAGGGEPESVYGLGPAASKVYGVGKGVSIGGYGEMIFQDFAAERDDGTRSGKTSEIDFLRAVLYFGYKFNDTIVFNSEIEYEHASTGDGGEVSVEFATIDFLLDESANVRAGMVLLPVGFINEMHEPPTFLGSRRPDVERLVIPATWRENGVGVFGDVGPFSYRAFVVDGLDAEGFDAGKGLREGRQNGGKAKARDVALTARADFHGVPGLVAGASFYHGDSGQGAEDAAGDVIDGTVTLYDLHAQYTFRGLQLRALYSSVNVDDAGRIGRDILGLDPSDPNDAAMGVGSRIRGWYAEAGYDVLSHLGERSRQQLTPFVRYERYDTQDRVPSGFISTGSNDVLLVTYGVSYKPIENIAIKVDYQNYERGDGSGTDQINAALGYLF